MDKLDQLLAAEAVRNLKARYFRFVDCKNWQGLASVFSEDVVLDLRNEYVPGVDPTAQESVVGRDAVVRLISKVVGRYRTIHHGHLPEIRVSSATAADGIWAMDDTIRDQEDRLVLRGSGYYHETYVRRGDDWTVSSMRLERLWVVYGDAGRDPAVPPTFRGQLRGTRMIRFDNQVAIVTGAGNGLGRTYAKALAARGARVVVNDLGRGGESPVAALEVVEEIKAGGGIAFADGANVADFAQVNEMVRHVVSKWGRIDILVNNAGALMPGTFLESSLEHLAGAMDVNFWGTVYPCKATWATMLAQKYGRIVMTTSSAGLYGSDGIIGYCAAKAALIGLINGLHAEGNSKGIRVNGIAPTAATNMNRALLPQKIIPLMQPEAVTPAVLYLVSPDAPSRTILAAGSGVFATTEIVEAAGEYLRREARTPEMIAERYAAISDSHGARSVESSFAQSLKFVRKAAEQEHIDIS